MFTPDDPLKPPRPVFDEPWQAQVLAIADALVRGGHVSATDWAETLGRELRRAADTGRPDTPQTYYLAALDAVETLCADIGITSDVLGLRHQEWVRAYKNTVHGQPVLLEAGQAVPVTPITS